MPELPTLRFTPELELFVAAGAAAARQPYAQAAALLSSVLPVEDGISMTDAKNRVRLGSAG